MVLNGGSAISDNITGTRDSGLDCPFMAVSSGGGSDFSCVPFDVIEVSEMGLCRQSICSRRISLIASRNHCFQLEPTPAPISKEPTPQTTPMPVTRPTTMPIEMPVRPPTEQPVLPPQAPPPTGKRPGNGKREGRKPMSKKTMSSSSSRKSKKVCSWLLYSFAFRGLILTGSFSSHKSRNIVMMMANEEQRRGKLMADASKPS